MPNFFGSPKYGSTFKSLPDFVLFFAPVNFVGSDIDIGDGDGTQFNIQLVVEILRHSLILREEHYWQCSSVPGGPISPSGT